MKNLISKISIILTLALLFFSCNNAELADSSTISATFNGNDYEESLTINVDDENTNLNGFITITAVHMKSEEKVYSKGFDFSSEDLSLIVDDDNTCRINAAEIQYLGTLVVYAKSRINSKFDKTFIINLESSLSSIKINYSLVNDNSKLNLDTSLKSGVINSLTKELTMVKGGNYNLEVLSEDETYEGSIKTIIPSSADTSSFIFSSITGNTCLLSVIGKDKAQAKITINVGRTKIKLDFYVEIKDVSKESISPYKITKKSEKNICLLANGSEDPDKSYDYQVNIEDVVDGRALQFSINAENITATRDAPVGSKYQYKKGDLLEMGTLKFEQYIKDNPAEDLEINEDADWYNEFNAEFKGEKDNSGTIVEQTFYKISFSRISKVFSIIPLEDTVWMDGSENLHSYLYMKYEDDENYRWKYRILIGGVLEGMQFVLVESNTSEEEEEIVDNTITIQDGDTTGWIFRLKYIPTTYKDNETYFYIGSASSTYGYTILNKTINLPIPAGMTKDNKKVDESLNKTINLSGLTSATDDVNGDAIPTTDTTSNLKVKQYVKFDKSDLGYHNLWATYGNNGEDISITAINSASGENTTIYIKNKQTSSITVKSVKGGLREAGEKSRVYSEGSVPKEVYVAPYTTRKSGSSTIYTMKASLSTNYNNSYIQEYPNTLKEDAITARTFYTSINSDLDIKVDSYFNISSSYVRFGEDAAKYITSAEITESVLTKNSITLTITTRYKSLLATTTSTYPDFGSCLTDKYGTYLYLTIIGENNETYTIPLRIIIYSQKQTSEELQVS